METVKTAEATRVAFALMSDIVLGTESDIKQALPLKPFLLEHHARSFRPHRLVLNVPCPGMVLLRKVTIAGIDLIHGVMADAWTWNPNAVGVHMDALEAEGGDVSISGLYTGLIPFMVSEKGIAPYPPNMAYTVTAVLIGPAILIG
jgi:hypothetical protein